MPRHFCSVLASRSLCRHKTKVEVAELNVETLVALLEGKNCQVFDVRTSELL